MRHLIFILLLLPCTINSQILINDLDEPDTTSSMIVSTYGSAFYQSQGISNDFSNKFLVGGFIDDELKEKVERQLTDQGNRLGIGFSAGFQFYDFRDTIFNNADWGFSLNLEHHALFNSSFTRDLFHAAFVGNADRVGASMQLGPTSFNQIVFQEFGASLVYKPTGCEFGISAIKGQSHLAMNATNMVLTTASDVSEITLDAQLNLQQVGDGNVNLATMNGAGVATNATYYIPIRVNNTAPASLDGKSKKSSIGKLRLAVDNLGFIAWTRVPQTYSVDSSYRFSGYEVENLFDADYNNVFDEQELKDSILPTAKEGTYYTMLPTLVSVSFIPENRGNRKLLGIAGAQYLFNANYRPLVYGGMTYAINEKLTSSIIGIVGGYGEITTGLRIKYSTKKIGAFISTNNLIGMISPSGYGKNLNGGALWRF